MDGEKTSPESNVQPAVPMESGMRRRRDVGQCQEVNIPMSKRVVDGIEHFNTSLLITISNKAVSEKLLTIKNINVSTTLEWSHYFAYIFFER